LTNTRPTLPSCVRAVYGSVFPSVFPTFTILGIVLSCVSNLSVATAVTFEIFPATKLVYFFLVAALVCAKLSQPLKLKTERAGLVMRTRLYTSKQATTTSFQQQLRSMSSQSQIGCPVIDWHQLRGWESPARRVRTGRRSLLVRLHVQYLSMCHCATLSCAIRPCDHMHEKQGKAKLLWFS
jgi:hypothetical protein